MRLVIPSTAPVYLQPPNHATAAFLMIKNTGTSTLYFAPRSTVTNGEPAGNDDEEEDAAILAAQGMPLEPGEYRDFAEAELDLNRRFYFISATEGDGAINYEYGV